MIVHIYHDDTVGIEWETGDRGRVRARRPEETDVSHHRLKGSFGKEFVVIDANPREYNREGDGSHHVRRITVGLEPGKFSEEGWPCPTLYGWDMEPLSPITRAIRVPRPVLSFQN